MLLAIDTSTKYGGVALHRDGELVASLCWRSQGNHTRELLPSVQHLLERVGGTIRDVRGIAVALGPGGFSSLRVGLSAAKGLALGLSVPVIGVGTLELEAYPYKDTGLFVQPLLAAGRGEVFTALFGPAQGQWSRLEEERILAPQELVAGEPDPTLFCGEAAPALADFLKERLGSKALVVEAYWPGLRLAALSHLGSQRLARGESSDVATLQPLYLRRPSIGRPSPPQRVKY